MIQFSTQVQCNELEFKILVYTKPVCLSLYLYLVINYLWFDKWRARFEKWNC